MFYIAYLDNILVYSNSIVEHISYVRKVLDKLLEIGLFLDINKCDFYIREVKYLGLIITTDRLKIELKKVWTIKD